MNYIICPGGGLRINGQSRRNEFYTIVEVKNGWGKLKSGAGWINLKYVKIMLVEGVKLMAPLFF